MTGALAAELARRGDTRPWVRGVVRAADPAGCRVTVEIEGAQVTLPALAAAYRAGDVVAVVRDPGGSGSGQFVAGVLSSPAPLWRKGAITAIDTTAKTITATVDGASVVMPHLTGTYAVGNVVAVLLDPASTIGPVVLGVLPSTVTEPTGPVVPPASSSSSTATATALIRPTWSGTWRASRGAWDRWNTGSYGGRSDLYQGSSPTSGALTGLACYGTQVRDLGATEILRIAVVLRHNGAGYGPTPFTVRGSTAATPPAGAPTATGTAVTSASIGPGARITVDLPDLDAWRTGTIAALALTGTGYGALYGTGRPDGMALEVSYRKAI